MRAIQITQFGRPEGVVRVVELQEPPAPGPGEVKVAVELSPLNKHDLLLASGALLRPPLPLVLGYEGVARIIEAGRDVGTVAVGDLVVVPLFAGAWRERLLLPAEGLFPLPEGSTEQFSMLGSNPPTTLRRPKTSGRRSATPGSRSPSTRWAASARPGCSTCCPRAARSSPTPRRPGSRCPSTS
jgi:NADPH:quinone reductase-like Zn-dependent oxidoreductase